MHEAAQVLTFLDSVLLWHCPILLQIAFVAHQDEDHLVLARLQVLVPLLNLLERQLTINSVNQDAALHVFHEQMGQIVDLVVSCSVPDPHG